ncbi:MAG: M15 family metallopeptidase [Rubrobacteraceae bacterium]
MRRAIHRRRRALAAAFALVCVSAVAYGFLAANRPETLGSEGRPPPTETAPVSSEDSTPEEPAKEGTNDTHATNPTAPLPPPGESCDDPRVLVGKRHALPPDYAPSDLASLMAYGVPIYGGDHLLREDAVEPLSGLVSEAASEGHELLVISAFRSYADQQNNFAHFTGIYGDDAEIVSAPPGQSQHQLGTTIDFTNAEVNYELLPAFGETDASKWLEANAWKHGFIITYPDGDEQGTGRQWEPWEYRHVGEELAGQIHESDMSLREFLTEEGVRPLC